jgi:type II secretory ATPase GspE/PulE/Tfp pilus assembly ATPase PilB-like protein
MGVEPFLLAATLQLLQAQRLIRRLCPKCKQVIHLTDELLQKVQMTKEDVVYGPGNVECEYCAGKGYRGRVGLFEVIPITRRIRDQVQARASIKDIYVTVHEEGIETLLDCGIGHARAGRTSMEEVLTVAMEDE